MERRKFLALSGVGLSTLAGCTGNSNNNGDNPESTGTQKATTTKTKSKVCFERPEADGVIPGNYENDGVELTIPRLVFEDEYSTGPDFDNPTKSQLGSKYLLIPVEIEVTGETQKRLFSEDPILYYHGVNFGYYGTTLDEIKVGDEQVIHIPEAVTGYLKANPGETGRGGYLFQVPNEFDRSAAAVQLPVTEETTATLYFDEESNYETPCISYTPPNSPLNVGESVEFSGIEYSINDIIPTNEIQEEGGYSRTPSDGEVFLAINIYTKNIGKVPISLPDRPTVLHQDNELDGVGVVLKKGFSVNGETYNGYFSDIRRNGQSVTNMGSLYPGIEMEGVIAVSVPKSYDKSDITIRQTLGNLISESPDSTMHNDRYGELVESAVEWKP